MIFVSAGRRERTSITGAINVRGSAHAVAATGGCITRGRISFSVVIIGLADIYEGAGATAVSGCEALGKRGIPGGAAGMRARVMRDMVRGHGHG